MRENYFFQTEEIAKAKKFLIVICYDIVETKRRNKLIKILEKYTVRVQKSVFEAMLTEKKTDKLCSEIEKFAIDEDNIRVYKISGSGNVTVYGTSNETYDEEVIIV